MNRTFSGLIGSFACCLPLLAPDTTLAGGTSPEHRGHRFLLFKNLSEFTSTSVPGEWILSSPEVAAGMDYDELIASWNFDIPNGGLTVEVRALYDESSTKFYNLGRWSSDPRRYPRESVLDQKDADGEVDTDTLKLKRPCSRFQFRLTVRADYDDRPVVKRLGIALTDSTWRGQALPPNRSAWGRTLQVPERSQMVYPNGSVLCSPTTVSMILAYWARELNHPDLDRDVPEISEAVYDRNWKGTGNWVFNTAWAGVLPGMGAVVTRLSDVAELEDLVGAGIPVGVSLCYNRLRGRDTGRSSGHLVVCVGFTGDGDVIVNDPGTSKNVRKIFPRKHLIYAWEHSKNAVYLIAPEGRLPASRFGHWAQ